MKFEKITGGQFYTYGGRYVNITFPQPYVVDETSKNKLKEALADKYSHLTKDTDDPIVKCTKLISE